jgi:aspartate racemase
MKKCKSALGPNLKKIGVIGGMGPLATIEMQKRIFENTLGHTDQDHIHLIIDCNTKIPDRSISINSNDYSIVESITSSAKILSDGGVDFIIIPCNTVHYFYNQFTPLIEVQVINMILETVKYVHSLKREETCLIFATASTIQSNIYKNEFTKNGITVEYPSEKDIDLIQYIIYLVKSGELDDAKKVFESIMSKYIKVYNTLLIACTELSCIYKSNDEKVIDSLDVLTKVSIVQAGYTYSGLL